MFSVSDAIASINKAPSKNRDSNKAPSKNHNSNKAPSKNRNSNKARSNNHNSDKFMQGKVNVPAKASSKLPSCISLSPKISASRNDDGVGSCAEVICMAVLSAEPDEANIGGTIRL